MAELTDLLKALAQTGGSDLHLVVGKPPMARLNGQMLPMNGATSAVASLIREGKTHQIYAAMEAGAKHGMISMDQHLAFLIKQGLIEIDDACSVAHDPGTVRQLAAQTPAAGAAA